MDNQPDPPPVEDDSGQHGDGDEQAEPDDGYEYSGDEAVYLEQGWNEEDRQRFYFLGQGSQLVPYNWFIHLQLPGTDQLLRSDAHLAGLGFITQAPGDRNPDGLPIGFVKDTHVVPIETKAAFLGSDYSPGNLPKDRDWLGLTCAACHTADLICGDTVVRIDGGAAMSDLERFLSSLAESMRATADDDEAFAAFAKRIQDAPNGGEFAAPPREEFAAYTLVIEALVERNRAKHPYGLARLDAFGAILNQITDAALNLPENRRESNAPVSYPFLWDTPHMDWVQWNSAAEIPIGRNTGEVLGVFAHFELTADPSTGYASSADLRGLHELEVALRRLQAPAWPEQYLGDAGKIDEAKAAAGKQLFADHCANCHNTRNYEGKFEMTPPNETGRQYIKTTSVPFSAIGTDPQMVLNFVTRTANPGILKGTVQDRAAALAAGGAFDPIQQLRASLGIPPADFTKEVPAGMLLSTAVGGVIKRYLGEALANRTDEEKAAILLDLRNGHAPDKDNRPPHGGAGYRARPLNGVWATAPYLHNGSVPNLWELLKPAEERVKSFHVGCREFDPQHVGLSTEEVPGSFHFQTESDGKPIPGNSNQGHTGPEHGTDWTDEQKWQVIEYIKTLR